jgi:5-methylcytosine-specific restriction protein B
MSEQGAVSGGLAKLVEIVHSPPGADWNERNREAFGALFGAPSGRYRKDAEKLVTVRAPYFEGDSGVPFAALIHPSNPTSGPYGGMSFVLFPGEEEPCLIAMVVGTHGLAPDEAILGRPGHARKMQAIARWLNRAFGKGRQVAWAKQDPTRVDIDMPDALRRDWSAYRRIFERYGKVIYAAYKPSQDRQATAQALAAFLDVMFEERGQAPLAGQTSHAQEIRASWFAHLMPSVTRQEVLGLLNRRRFVILEGPPGTGKTLLAWQILREEYGGRGRSIQFHPGITYENFVGGLAPIHTDGALGLHFAPVPGFLMEAAAAALEEPDRPYLLLIDEINRADLSKVLGEAIHLFEADPGFDRIVDLAYDFGPPFHRSLRLPRNLHLLGTMNSADRSIAIVDVAVRRRFAFVTLWPSSEVVAGHGCAAGQRAFERLISIFVEHASEEALALAPGHSYFLEKDERKLPERLRTELAPLLREYLAQGYVTGFAEEIRSYLQWLDSLGT